MERLSGAFVLIAFFVACCIIAITTSERPLFAAWDPPMSGGFDLTESGSNTDLLNSYYLRKVGDTMSGALNMGNNGITNIDWSASDDGTDSGLDADLLDGQHGTDYMAASMDRWVDTTGDTMTGSLTISAPGNFTMTGNGLVNGVNKTFEFGGTSDLRMNTRQISFDLDDDLNMRSTSDDALAILQTSVTYWILTAAGDMYYRGGRIATLANNQDIYFEPNGTGIVTSASRIAATAATGPLNLGGAAIDGHTLGDADVIIGGSRFEVDAQTHFDAPIHLPPIIGTSITEPFPCNGAVPAATVYCDDTDDTSWAAVCICALLDGTGWDWRDLSDISGTACPCF